MANDDRQTTSSAPPPIIALRTKIYYALDYEGPILQFCYDGRGEDQYMYGLDVFLTNILTRRNDIKVIHLFPLDCPKSVYQSYVNSMAYSGITVQVHLTKKFSDVQSFADSLFIL